MKILYLTDKFIYINQDGRIIRKEISYEKGIVTSSIGYKHLININFKLPKSINQETLELEVERYLFESGSLDYSREYKIVFFSREIEDGYQIEAFVVDIEVLKENFEKFIKIFKYIDFISAKPFVFESYYDLVKQVPKIDLFIYFNEDDSFVSCFREGEFLFVKSTSKLFNLAKSLGISIESCIELLRTKGLDKENYDNLDTYEIVEKFFSEMFMKISSLINYSINYYSLPKIDRIFFYSPFEIKNLFKEYEQFWNLSGIEFKKYHVDTDYDSFDYTAAIYNSKHYNNKKENFSIFLRPEPLYKRKSGQFLVFSFLLIFILIGNYIYLIQKVKSLKKEIEIREKQKKIYLKKEKLLRYALKKKKEEIKKLILTKKSLENELNNILIKLDFLSLKQQYSFYNQFAIIVSLLKDNNLKIVSFEKNKRHYEIVLKSKYDISKNIARFMIDLRKKNFKNVETNGINLVVENGRKFYVSKVSFDEIK